MTCIKSHLQTKQKTLSKISSSINIYECDDCSFLPRKKKGKTSRRDFSRQKTHATKLDPHPQRLPSTLSNLIKGFRSEKKSFFKEISLASEFQRVTFELHFCPLHQPWRLRDRANCHNEKKVHFMTDLRN